MSRDDEAWKKHLQSATRSVSGVHRTLEAVAVPALTVLAHPDPRRVGERAVLTNLLSEGGAVPVSRLEPLFAQPRGGPPRPLADPRLSRTPIRFVSGPDGGVVVKATASRTPVVLAGEPLAGEWAASAAALDSGVVLVLAQRVALLLHLVATAPPVDVAATGLIGDSNAIVRVRREISRVARFDFPVLLCGESGTGKELVARAIHDAGPRRDGPYLAVNVGAIPPTLAVAELFGAARGAYSGADRSRRGYFQRATGGSLFLDEIGEAPPEVQVLLLRALETQQIQPVGSEDLRRVDVRVIAATDADLGAAVATGEFRSPLLHRLASYEIVLAPLRERREDFGRLFFHFLREELMAVGATDLLRPTAADESPWVPADLVAQLAAHAWPGNVRQLKNAVRQLVVANLGRPRMELVPAVSRMLTNCVSPISAADDAARGMQTCQRPERYREPGKIGEAELRQALRLHRWEVRSTAKALNVSRTSCYELMERFRIRKASELGREEIVRCLQRHGPDLDAMVEDLEVSKPGLKSRMKELGLR